jgi:hypothetical protein
VRPGKPSGGGGRLTLLHLNNLQPNAAPRGRARKETAVFTTLAAIGDYFYWWQAPLVVVLVALIIFYVMYKKKQM